MGGRRDVCLTRWQCTTTSGRRRSLEQWGWGRTPPGVCLQEKAAAASAAPMCPSPHCTWAAWDSATGTSLDSPTEPSWRLGSFVLLFLSLLSICLSVCLSVCLYVCLSIHPPVRLSVYHYIYAPLISTIVPWYSVFLLCSQPSVPLSLNLPCSQCPSIYFSFICHYLSSLCLCLFKPMPSLPLSCSVLTNISKAKNQLIM